MQMDGSMPVGMVQQDGCNLVSTEEMGAHLLAELDRIAD